MTTEYSATIFDEAGFTTVSPGADGAGLILIERAEDGVDIGSFSLTQKAAKELAEVILKIVSLHRPSFNANMLEGLVYPQASPFPLGR